MTELSLRYIPILCSLPLLYAHNEGLFEQEGLSVDLRPAPGWSAIKELLVHGKIDAAHMLSAMPLACAAGIDGMPADLRMCMMQNVNGQALVLAQRHRQRSPAELHGLTFGVPYPYSMQYYLLCHYLTQQGINPLRDIRILEVVPPQMPQYLADGTIDGFLGPEPYVQLAVLRKVGFIFLLSKQIWPGHPCCGLATSSQLLARAPHTIRALLRSVLAAQKILHQSDARQREQLIAPLAERYFANMPEKQALTQALIGRFPDGRGAEITESDHIDYLPYLRLPVGEWITSQMQRWGQLPIEVDGSALARRVLLTESVAAQATAFGFVEPAADAWLPSNPHDDIATLAFAEPRHQAAQAQHAYEIAAPLRARLRQILEQLSEATAAGAETELRITSNDEVGWLEQMINEVIRNSRFARQAIQEKVLLEEESRRQQHLLVAQEELLRQLSVPVIPLIPQVLLFPLIGNINAARLQHLVETILVEITQRRAQIALLDLTGIGELDEHGIAGLHRGMAAVRLLGARCILVGITAVLASRMVALGVKLEQLVVKRDVASALEYALGQLGIVLGQKS